MYTKLLLTLQLIVTKPFRILQRVIKSQRVNIYHLDSAKVYAFWNMFYAWHFVHCKRKLKIMCDHKKWKLCKKHVVISWGALFGRATYDILPWVMMYVKNLAHYKIKFSISLKGQSCKSHKQIYDCFNTANKHWNLCIRSLFSFYVIQP